MFLGQEPGLSRLDLVDRSLALDVLVDYFFLEWSKSRGRMIARADQCSLVALGNFVSLYCTAALSFTLFSPLSTFLSLLSPHYCLRTMNAGLGNCDAYRSADAVSQDDGRVVRGPLCLIGPNNELHLVMHCHCLVTTRLSIHL